MIGKEALALVEKYSYLGKTISPTQLTRKKSKEEQEWEVRAFGKHNTIMNNKLPFFRKGNV